jgi:hypothetical protein
MVSRAVVLLVLAFVSSACSSETRGDVQGQSPQVSVATSAVVALSAAQTVWCSDVQNAETVKTAIEVLGLDGGDEIDRFLRQKENAPARLNTPSEDLNWWLVNQYAIRYSNEWVEACRASFEGR